MNFVGYHRKNEIKEEFCPVCVVAPMAFAGIGATAVGGTMSKKHKKWKKALLISGGITIALTLLMIGYYWIYNRECKSCKL